MKFQKQTSNGPGPFSRRRFLQGLGVSMTLPWLESLPVWGESTAEGNVANPYPKRIATLFMANGVNKHHWWARQTESGMELGKSLQPLEPYKQKLNFITGLFNKNATGVGIHPGQTGNLLSGASLQKGAELRGGISMDQVLANHIGQQTVQPLSRGLRQLAFARARHCGGPGGNRPERRGRA